MQQFHQAEWSARHGICGQLDDLRYAEFGLKLLYAEMPHVMPAGARQDVERHIRERLLAEGGDVPRLTIAGAPSAVSSLRSMGEDVEFLNEIKTFICAMASRVAWPRLNRK